MWILSRVNNDDKVYLLRDKTKYTVGRNKTCDIVSESTQSSVGRFHATLHPYEDRVEVIDTESKYGTYINEQIHSNMKINPNTPLPLKDGDTIRFGFIDFTWKLEKIVNVVLTSTMTVNEKNNLRKDVSTLGGQVIDQWSDTCTHLVVKNLTLTVKVLQGLCHAIPIVKPEYFKAMLHAIRNKSTMPNVETYQPTIVERIAGSTVSLQANIDRKRLFVGKTFVFMNSKHMEMFKGIIECGMGQCSSLDTKKWQRRSLVNAGIIVISNTTSSTQSQVSTQIATEMNDFLRSKGSRMVPDSEISLAILHCSLDKFCNPNHTLMDNFESQSRVVPTTSLVDNTPVNRIETAASTSPNSINVPETVEQPNTIASTVPNNSNVIVDLMDDDDDDVMLVQSADLAMSIKGTSKGKRKKSTDQEEPPIKKRNLNNSAKSTTKSVENFVFNTPQLRSTRSASKNKNFSTTNESTKIVHQEITKPEPEPSTSSSQTKNKPLLQDSNRHEPTEKNSEEISIIEHSSQARARSATSFKPIFATSTQIESPISRKRIAHRPNASTFPSTAGNDSDSDEDLFKFNIEPAAKKPRPSKDSDSDSDDNIPQSSGPVAPVSVPLRPFTQPPAPGSWLSRPTPSQTLTNATIRTKSTKRNVPKPKSANISAGWQIGQFCISTPPIQIPTQGWCSKDTIKSASVENEVKQENSNGDSLFEDSKGKDSIICGIQVITKSMNLISTSGKVFKKQSFIVPTEIIKTSKVYEY